VKGVARHAGKQEVKLKHSDRIPQEPKNGFELAFEGGFQQELLAQVPPGGLNKE